MVSRVAVEALAPQTGVETSRLDRLETSSLKENSRSLKP